MDLKAALAQGLPALTEFEAKALLKDYGLIVTRERLVLSRAEALEAAEEIGWPVALKFCSREMAHKTEARAVLLNLSDPQELDRAFTGLEERLAGREGGYLVQEMISGRREMVMGLTRDAQFGPCVMFGLGGIFTEALDDVTFRAAPLSRADAQEMLDEIKGRRLLGPVRNLAPADREALIQALLGLSRLSLEMESIAEIDINPLIITDQGQPVAVDALVLLNPGRSEAEQELN